MRLVKNKCGILQDMKDARHNSLERYLHLGTWPMITAVWGTALAIGLPMTDVANSSNLPDLIRIGVALLEAVKWQIAGVLTVGAGLTTIAQIELAGRALGWFRKD